MGWFEHDGKRIYYEEEGSGEPVLVLPGWGGSIEEFRPLREALQGRYRVIAADVPGSGRSGPQPREYTATYYIDDARALTSLLEQAGAMPAHLLGFSDGGEYALLTAATRPDVAMSVATWGAAGKLDEPMPGMFDAFGALIDDPIEPLAGFAAHMKATYGEENARKMVQSAARAFREISSRGGDISRSLAGDIRCSALLIAGEEDFLATPALVGDMAAAIPNGRFQLARGAGHAVHETHGDWLIATIVAWLAEVATPAPQTSRS